MSPDSANINLTITRLKGDASVSLQNKFSTKDIAVALNIDITKCLNIESTPCLNRVVISFNYVILDAQGPAAPQNQPKLKAKRAQPQQGERKTAVVVQPPPGPNTQVKKGVILHYTIECRLHCLMFMNVAFLYIFTMDMSIH